MNSPSSTVNPATRVLRPRRNLLLVALALSAAWLTGGSPLRAQADKYPWQVGVASVKITPKGPMWMAGYANRTKPSDGVDLDIFAKALAVDDGAGGRVVMVTTDLVSIPLSLRQFVERECGQRYGLKPDEILLNASHTHSAPEVRPERMRWEQAFSRAASPQQVADVDQYSVWLEKTLVTLVGDAWQRRAPAALAVSHGRAGFAMNRRRPEAGGRFSNNPYPDGPVDQEVPVLKVTGADGKMKAVLFGYACHNTTLGGSRISGDYAGYAQKFLEESYPGATALFMMGCGGDQNPYPRRAISPTLTSNELVQQHGRALSNAVTTALDSVPRPVRGPLRPALDSALLDYVPVPKPELQKYLSRPETEIVKERARSLIQSGERGEKFPPLPCPVQVVRFGRDLTLVAIGGEVVIDYAIRIKSELKGPAYVWVAGYTNNVFGYIASRRVLEEGGYEGGGANTRILVHPGTFTFDAEEKILAKVHDLIRRTNP